MALEKLEERAPAEAETVYIVLGDSPRNFNHRKYHSPGIIAAFADRQIAEAYANRARRALAALCGIPGLMAAVRRDSTKRYDLNPLHPSFEPDDRYSVRPVQLLKSVPRHNKLCSQRWLLRNGKVLWNQGRSL